MRERINGNPMISIIIPTYNEEMALPETLRHLLQQPGDYEVIVVDGGSTDQTCKIINAAPRVRLLTASKGRASQMNAGARHATGEWLLFLHADTFLPDGALVRLNGFEADHAIQAGGFLHRFSGHDWRLRMVSFLDNVRCRCSRIIYGDQAMFVRRALFEQLGGFPDHPVLEDVSFCEKLIRVVTPVLLSPPVLTDARKFVKMGVWRSFARVLLIILHVEFRFPVLPRAFFRDIR
ncbi:MAG TPA: TIGR04283 family arsenosugar biosynthesis glycosyltransferase [Nitrospira sp.]|nr:TIGR04283 family arsenosugar biosynthesis glycosyltransferase [Nitrospira sp.]